MASESQNLSTAKVDAPNYKVIAEQIGALMQAGKQSGMDQTVIRAAIETFGQVATNSSSYGNACATGRCIG